MGFASSIGERNLRKVEQVSVVLQFSEEKESKVVLFFPGQGENFFPLFLCHEFFDKKLQIEHLKFIFMDIGYLVIGGFRRGHYFSFLGIIRPFANSSILSIVLSYSCDN